MDEAQIEAFSHYPELFFRYGRPKLGLRALRRAMHPDLPRKEYPEASFCAIGALASGLMGLMLDAPSRSVRTEPGLTDIEWAELRHIPFPHGELHLLHKGQSSSLDNATEEAVIWTAYGQTVSVPPHTTRELWTGRQKSTF